jgi:hypothetical protein
MEVSAVRFVRVGTLDDPGRVPPDVHIHTSSKQPWLALPADALAVEGHQVTAEVWPGESLEHRAALLDAIRNRGSMFLPITRFGASGSNDLGQLPPLRNRISM